MHWRHFLVVMLGVVLVGWLRTTWAGSDELVVAALIVLVVSGRLVGRAARNRRFRDLAELDADELRIAIDELSAGDAARARMAFGISFEPERAGSYAGTKVFSYRPGSRSLNTFLFWTCVLLAGVMLIPVAAGRFDAPAEVLPWFLLAGVLLASGFGYRKLGREIDAEIVLDPRGIRLIGAGPADRTLDWLEVVSVRRIEAKGLYRALELRSGRGQTLMLDSQIPEFDELVEQILGNLVVVHCPPDRAQEPDGPAPRLRSSLPDR